MGDDTVPSNSEQALVGPVLERVPSGTCADGYGPTSDLSERSSLIAGPGHDFLAGVELHPPTGHSRPVISGLRRLLHDTHSTKVTFRGCSKWVLARRLALCKTPGQKTLVWGFR